MASTLEPGQLFSIRNDQMPAFDRPGSSRAPAAMPIGPGINHSSWSSINNIWKTSGAYQGNSRDIGTNNGLHEKSENIVDSKLTHRPVSPDRHDSLSRPRMPNPNSTSMGREQRSIMSTADTYRQINSSLPPVTSSINRALAPLMPSSLTRSQGLSTLITGPSMSKLSTATLLSGSAPDIEPSHTTLGYTHRHQGESQFRALDIEGVNEFIPSFQHNAVEKKLPDNRFTYGYGYVAQPHTIETGPTRNPVYVGGQMLSSEQHLNPQPSNHFHDRLAPNSLYGLNSTERGGDLYGLDLNPFGGEYDLNKRRISGVPDSTYLMKGSTEYQQDAALIQRPTELRARMPGRFENGQSNGYKVPGTTMNTQAHEYQYQMYVNRNAYLSNNGSSPQTASDSRNGFYTPAFTPPSAPESQRSTSESGPSTGVSSQVVESTHRPFENSQMLPQNRTNQDLAYPLQTPHGYVDGFQQPAAYSDAYAANRMINAMGPEPHELREQREDPEKPISPFLKEFKTCCKTKRYELKDVYGYIVEFSGDQHGSRFIQGKLETANSDEKEQVFTEIQENALQLMTDIFGNYVIQKLFEHGTQAQKKVLANQMKGRVLYLTTQVYGCRVVQKALEHVLTDQQAGMVKELEGHVLPIVENQNGNHVIQKAIERVPGEHIQFIVDALKGQVVRLAKHNYGCRVVQRMLEYGQPSVKRSILTELHLSVTSLIADTFGNYVVQHIIRHGEPADRYRVVALVQQQLLFYSKHKFASNVVEAAIESAEESQRQEILRGLTGADMNGQTPVCSLIRDQYGNYVIQKVLQRLTGVAKDDLIRELRYSLVALRRITSGKQVSAIEKAIAEATDGHGQTSPSRATYHGSRSFRHVAAVDYYHPRMPYQSSPGAFPRMSMNGVRS